jgi:hypothetical protein
MSDEYHKALQAKADELETRLENAIALLRKPFSTAETGDLENQMPRLAGLVHELQQARLWSPSAAPQIDLPNSQFANPKDHRDYIAAWSDILKKTKAEIAAFRKFAKT